MERWHVGDHWGSLWEMRNSDSGLLGLSSLENLSCKQTPALRPLDTLGSFRYIGYMWESASNIYPVGARWYDLFQGRWLSRDPLGLAADSNPYRYVSNTPTNAVDPWGLFFRDINIGVPIILPIGNGVIIPIGGGIQIGDGPPPMIPGLPRQIHPYIGFQWPTPWFSIYDSLGEIRPGLNIGAGINMPRNLWFIPQRLLPRGFPQMNLRILLPRNIRLQLPLQWQRIFVFNGGQVVLGGLPNNPGITIKWTVIGGVGPHVGAWFVI
jgi:RHS repeat-associated protein